MKASWNGTLSDYLELTRALDHHCACSIGFRCVRQTCCSAHELAGDQRALNGLLYARRILAKLRDEEWLVRQPSA